MELSSEAIVAQINTTHVWDVKISDENDKLICISRCTVAVVDRPPDNGSPLMKQIPSFG